MARRTKDQRREDYLAIGAGLVAEAATGVPPDPGLALAHVKVADVADRAGVTKGAIYHLWPSQEDYWHDLLVYLFEEDQLLSERSLAIEVQRMRQAVESDDEHDLTAYANVIFDRVKDDPALMVRLGIYPYLHEDGVRARLDEEFRSGIDALSEFFEWALAHLGLRLRPDTTIEQFATAVIALLHGTVLEYRIHSDRTPDVSVDGRRVSAFAAGAGALINGFTEPVADSEVA